MTEWKDVLQTVVSSLGQDAQSTTSVLEFMTVLPEEFNPERKIPLPVCAAKINTSLLASFVNYYYLISSP